MHPDLERLIALQQLDLQGARLREEMAAAPRRMAALEAEVRSARAALDGILEKLAKEETLRRRLESDIKEHQQKIARLGKQTDTVTTSAQAAALEHEIGFARTEVSRLEDEELDGMERAERLESDKKDAEETLTNTERRHVVESAQSAEALERARASLAEVESRREALRGEIGESALDSYDRISKAKGTGVAEGVDQRCSACQMLVRPQRWNDLRDRARNEEMLTCESCGRLLYWDPARDAPQKKENSA